MTYREFVIIRFGQIITGDSSFAPFLIVVIFQVGSNRPNAAWW